MTRKTRSPLHGATRGDLASLRALISSRLAWEAALGTPQQYLHPDEPLFALTSLSFATVEKIRDRSRNRWQQMPHFHESYEVYRDQHMQTYDRAAWEQKQLRLEVEKLRAEVADVRGAIG